jgi:hypothetical protein
VISTRQGRVWALDHAGVTEVGELSSVTWIRDEAGQRREVVIGALG